MNWVEVTVRTNTAGADMVSEQLMHAGAKGTVIEDRNDAALDVTDPAKWDILDASIVEAMDEDVLVRGYLPEEVSAVETLAQLRLALAQLTPDMLGFDAGSLAVEVAGVREEDWAENWKKYYKPFRVGDHLVIKPVWEAFLPREGDKIIEIDPGMAFGNGTHETTSMCLRLMETLVSPGDTVLDVGTGSGILALAAALQGAGRVLGVDVDPVAVRVAQENIQRNGLADVVTAQVGDLLGGIDIRANVVVANIIADVIILLSGAVRGHLLEGGAFVCSGIIREREADVVGALLAAGFTIEHIERQGEWIAVVARS